MKIRRKTAVPRNAGAVPVSYTHLQRRTTLLLWALFFLVMFGFYFIMSWTPKLLVAAGLSTAQGIAGGTLLSIGGIFGAALLGGLAARFRCV